LLPAPEGDTVPALTKLVLSGIPRAVWPARFGGIAWGLLLLGAVYWGVARTRGAAIGLVAAALVSMVPEVLAHASLAGSDVPFAATAMLSLVLMARYAEQPTRGRWWSLALAIGLAWATRHTALLLVLLAAGVHAWCALRSPRGAGFGPVLERLCGSAWASAGLTAMACLVLWASDGFGTVSLAEASASITRLSVPQQIGSVDLSGLPVPTSVLSILKQVSHQARGHEAYFCGEVSQRGWSLYFPIAFLLKTPIGLLALLVLAVARMRPRGAWEAICLVFLALLWASLVRSKVNIGVRYALLTYPLAAPFVARLFEPGLLRDRVWGPVTLAAAIWFAGASGACHPRYLSYFNELAGGPQHGWLYLADSNIDWGQDFDALAAALKRRGLNDVTLDVSSERRLIEPGLCALPNPSRELQPPAETPPNRRLYDSEGSAIPVFTRYVAVSVSRLLGLYSRNDMSWLRTRRLVERVGDTIFIFDMDQPAERPFGS
ncbi:MAG TPA: glycosyltransferase family 39 protein, partial [Isosphaeraceae bacterium]|nr:glycosyltransferase family 39 protein [Isosphaeraceae bacterium]